MGWTRGSQNYEALGLGIVIWIARRAHRSSQACILEGAAVGFAGVLAAAIGVMDATCWWLATLNCGLQRGQCQWRVNPAGDGVAHDLAAARVQDGCQVAEPSLDADIREVSAPSDIWTARNHVVVQIGEGLRVVVAEGTWV